MFKQTEAIKVSQKEVVNVKYTIKDFSFFRELEGKVPRISR